MMPRRTAERRSKRRMFEHTDVRVRRGSPFGKHRGQLRQYDIAETVMPGAMILATFPERKATRSAGAEWNQDMDVERPRHWIPAFAGMTTNNR